MSVRKPSARDLQVAQAVKDTRATLDGNHTAAVKQVADALGYQSEKAVYGILGRVKAWERAQGRGEPALPMPPVPNGHDVKGVSSLLNEQGEIVRQWVKSDRQQDDWQARIDRMVAAAGGITPLPPVPRAGDTSGGGARLTLYPATDWHVGLYAGMSAGWDLHKTYDTYYNAFRETTERPASSDAALLAFMGDMTHTDNLQGVTPRSGKSLDVSGLYGEIIDVTMQLIVDAIGLAAAKHRAVEVVYLSGNHDEATGIVMQAALRRIYTQSPQVHVWNGNGERFFYHRHFNVALGITHGHTVKADALPLLMAAERPQLWGATAARFWHTGHIHHKTVTEYAGCIVESHGSPSPKDKWHQDSGYRSLRRMQSITYSPHGEHSRAIVNLD